MRLRELKLRDFGTLRGEQTLELAPRERYGHVRPVILVGGQNGAGKTTILEAIRLCLYGKLALGPRTGDAEYKQYLRERIHRSKDALINPSSASVELVFDYARGGTRHIYTVERSWEISGRTLSDHFRVTQDGKPLSDVESQHWESFVRSLVPYGLSQLFFFDGEKIQRLAEDGVDTATLAESVKSLLGLDLVEQLNTDLDIFESRHLRKSVKGADQRRLGQIEKECAKLEARRNQLWEEIAGLKTKLDGLERDTAKAENELSLRGKGLVDERGDLRKKTAELEALIEQDEKQLRELFDGSLVFSACPRLAEATIAQLEQERKLERWETSSLEVRSALGRAKMRLTRPAFIQKTGTSKAGAKLIEQEIQKITDEAGALPKDLRALNSIHKLAEADAKHVIAVLGAALGSDRRRAKTLADELTGFEAALREAMHRLKQAPDEDDIAPLVVRLNRLAELRGALTTEHQTKAEDHSEVSRQLAQLERERARIVKSRYQRQAWDTKRKLVGQVRKALDDYLERLTAQKMTELERVAAETFEQLCRKTDLVREIRIDPETFRVVLLDQHGRELPRKDLSAGEKQIYAVSILWSLAKVSGRPLPMIIDTPLGRLDSRHRQNLVEHYFPVAAHQVIILSTDTEIDEIYFESLRPHLSHAIHLAYHQAEGWTEAQQGYFWNKQEELLRAAASA